MKKNKILVLLLIPSLLSFSFVFKNEDKKRIERIRYELPEIRDTSKIVSHLAYTLSYEEKYEQAEWVAYLLTRGMISKENERGNNFREDPLVETGSASPADYSGSGYDKGHLAPAADMVFSKETMSESFFMSNMSPQKPGFNREIWKKLEEEVREYAEEFDSIYVATGPILKNGLKTIGRNKVSVPEYYYKVIAIYRRTDPEDPKNKRENFSRGIGLLLANKSSKEDLKNYAVPIDSVEILTRIDFFEKIPRVIQDKIEKECKIEDWISK